MPARRFLWIVAILLVLILAIAILWRLAGDRMLRFALTPGAAFDAAAVPPAPDYARGDAWLSRPGVRADDPARWTPAQFSAAPRPAALVFFVSPTGYLDRAHWNAPIDDPETVERLDALTRMQASVFNGVGEIWIPRYRQATFGAFLKPGPDSVQALAIAYGDVLRAFDAFLKANPGNRPIILAGHSQGSLHILHLLKDRGAAIADRLVAVYAPGWPYVVPQDSETLNLPACTAAEQTGCVLSWQSYAADGDIDAAAAALSAVPDIMGRKRPPGALMACVNPLTGSTAPASADSNAGTLISDRIEPHRVGARCAKDGLLLIDPPPSDIGAYVLPGGNYHVYDYALFWANLRADVEARLSAYGAANMAEDADPEGAVE